LFTPLRPIDEEKRLAALYRLGILDTPPEERFDRITLKAMNILAVPVSLLGFVDSHRVWNKSRQGVHEIEIPRDQSISGYSILREEVFHVSDTAEDARFFDHPLVTGRAAIRMFASCPIHSPDGFAIGALTVSDRKPRQLTREEYSILQVLAGWVEEELYGIGAGDPNRREDMTALARRLLHRALT